MKNQEQTLQHISTRYTIVPINEPQHQRKIQEYLFKTTHQKTSFCRFYLRGICIMKPNMCRFAHSFQQLNLQQDQQELIRDCNYTQKQRKKKYFQQRADFQQKPLFILKNVDYWILYNYQFSDKWIKGKKTMHIYSIQQIKTDRNIRLRLRQVLHRENWNKLLQYLINKFTGVDYPIDFLSKWFSKVGFQKPQTRCKFGDFMRYMINVMNFKQVNVVVPPRIQKSVFFVNCDEKSIKTYMYENIEQLEQQHLKAKEQYKKQLLLKLQPLPKQLYKKFMCRYYMAGNCQWTQEQCNYAHSIQALKYQMGQFFQNNHKQMVKGRQQRLNYVSLFRYSCENIDQKITLDELNGNANIRQDYRRIMHRNLYKNFLKLIQDLSGNQRLQLSFIEKCYNGAGFNHSQENKFGQFEGSLWEIGYTVQDVKFQNQLHKIKYVFKIPPIQQLDKYFSILINEILIDEVQKININKIKLDNQSQKNSIQTSSQEYQKQTQVAKLILQSSFRKKIYHLQQTFSIPLHIYLKLKSCSLQQILKQLITDKQLLNHIFFETNQQNYKKLVQICKNYFKSSKQYIHKLDNIQLYIKNLHKDQINLNGFVNFRNLLQSAIIDSGKRIYSLNFGNNTLIIDKANLCLYEKTFIKAKYSLKNHQNINQQYNNNTKDNLLSKERIVIVDNQQTFLYASEYLKNCNKLGVDLQGKLRKQGYIDLIQISGKFNNLKQIFVFDIFVINRIQDKSLYQKTKEFLKNLFQDQNKVKILHDCKQDSAALRYLMGIQLKNVFDTSGMNIILQQKQHYLNWNKKEQTNHHLLKKVFQVKTPGLNTILDKWGAPNGVNIFKDDMKKLFGTEGTRKYFQLRPIDPQFLEYSVQDVEDLIEVYQNMKLQDTQKISQFIGELFVSFSQ